MNSLQSLRGYGKKSIVALMIIGVLTVAAAAQTLTPQEQGKRYGDPGFVGEPANLKVVNTDIRDILSYITEQYGINFVIDKSVGAVPVTVNVTDVPWNVALDSILRAQNLGVQVNGSILRIAEQKILADEQAIQMRIRDNQLDTSPLYTEFIRLNYARASGGLAQSTTTSGTSGATAGAGVGAQANGGEGLLPIIKRRLSRRGGIEIDGRSNTLIITDVRENIDAVRQLIALLDQAEPQVEIEARIVVATRSFSRDLGVQLAGLVLGRNGRAASLGTAPGTGVPATTTGLVPNGIPNGVGIQPNNTLLSSIPNTVLGLTTGIFGTAQISLLITAGEQKNQAKTIATPRVTTLNNRQAEIKSGLKIPVTTIQPSSGGGAVVATTEYVDVPLRLQITPQITDMGTVILNVAAENSSLTNGGAISSQSVTTEVMVPDGGTTVVGGVLSDIEGETQDRTPGLSKVPFLGNLFKRKGVTRDASEILFFITPRIYRPDMAGNPTSGTISTGGMRSTTILQPVPLGNPGTNSETPNGVPQLQQQQNQAVPLSPVIQPGQPVINPNNRP